MVMLPIIELSLATFRFVKFVCLCVVIQCLGIVCYLNWAVFNFYFQMCLTNSDFSLVDLFRYVINEGYKYLKSYMKFLKRKYIVLCFQNIWVYLVRYTYMILTFNKIQYITLLIHFIFVYSCYIFWLLLKWFLTGGVMVMLHVGVFSLADLAFVNLVFVMWSNVMQYLGSNVMVAVMMMQWC